MKKLSMLFAAFTIFSSLNIFAGTRETGGMPRAPMGVVIQGHMINGEFDLVGQEMSIELAAEHFSQRKALVLSRRIDSQAKDRTTLCIEYKSMKDAYQASEEFKRALARHPSLEVVSAYGCN